MWYVIFSEDVENSLPLRLQVRAEHLARLQELLNQDRLLVAGPNPTSDTEDLTDTCFSGSTVIAQFKTLEDAKSWANEDPYNKAGVYKNIIVKPFKKVFPA